MFAGVRIGSSWAKACATECISMLQEQVIRNKGDCLSRLDALDKVSQRICRVIDAAELGRCVSSDVQDEAQETFSYLGPLIARLNTDPLLYQAMTSGGGVVDMTEEQRRVLHSYVRELELHGAHLSDSSTRSRLEHLHWRSQELSDEVRQGHRSRLREMLLVRKEMAQMCGAKSYAELNVSGRDLKEGGVDGIKQWMRMLTSSNVKHDNHDDDGDGDGDLVLGLDAAVDVMLDVTRQVYGVDVKQVKDGPFELWKGRGVRWINVEDSYVVLDLEERRYKFDQHATFMLRFGVENADVAGENTICAVVMGLPRNRSLRPVELEGLFHEWGHALSASLCKTRYQQLHGTRASLDCAELPSTINEMIVWHPQVLSRVGVEKDKVRKYGQRAHNRMRHSLQNQASYALLDLELHGENVPSDQQLKNIPYIAHLGPYGASYYTYALAHMWSEKIWQSHFQGDLTNAGVVVRDELLRHGGAKNVLSMVAKCSGGRDAMDWSDVIGVKQ